MPATVQKTPAFYETAPIHFRAQRTVAATPEEVFAVLADTPNWPKWFPALTDAVWTSPAPHGVGSTRTVSIGPIKIKERFIVWDEGKAWGFTFVGTTIPVVKAGAERVDLEPDGTGTKVTYNMFVEPLPGMGWLTRRSRASAEKGLADGLKGLDEYLAKA